MYSITTKNYFAFLNTSTRIIKIKQLKTGKIIDVIQELYQDYIIFYDNEFRVPGMRGNMFKKINSRMDCFLDFVFFVETTTEKEKIK